MTNEQFEKYVQKAKETGDDYYLDQACINHLKSIACDYGENGELANSLLNIVKKLLEIH